MIKHLTKHGNSLALIIDRAVLEMLEINADTPLNLTTDGKCLMISPVRDHERSQRFQEALAKGNQRYGRMLKRLAE